MLVMPSPKLDFLALPLLVLPLRFIVCAPCEFLR
jgi:hypothetical protein